MGTFCIYCMLHDKGLKERRYVWTVMKQVRAQRTCSKLWPALPRLWTLMDCMYYIRTYVRMYVHMYTLGHATQCLRAHSSHLSCTYVHLTWKELWERPDGLWSRTHPWRTYEGDRWRYSTSDKVHWLCLHHVTCPNIKQSQQNGIQRDLPTCTVCTYMHSGKHTDIRQFMTIAIRWLRVNCCRTLYIEELLGTFFIQRKFYTIEDPLIRTFCLINQATYDLLYTDNRTVHK